MKEYRKYYGRLNTFSVILLVPCRNIQSIFLLYKRPKKGIYFCKGYEYFKERIMDITITGI